MEVNHLEKPLFMTCPEDEVICELESPEDYGYWEEDVDDAVLSAMLNGNITNKLCFHCGCKGHIRTQCPEQQCQGAPKVMQHKEEAKVLKDGEDQ